jgi:sugar-phosphatase
LLAARRLGIDPAGCVVVEDAPAGIEAGRGAGMRVIAVAATHRPEELAAARFIVAALDCIEIEALSGAPISLHLRGCGADNGG